MDLRDYRRIIRRQIRIILISASIVMLFYLVTMFKKPVQHVASAKLYIRPPTFQEDVLLTSTIAPNTNSFRVTVGNQLLIMQSRSLAREAAIQINLAKKFKQLSPSEQNKIFLSPFGPPECSGRHNLTKQLESADFKEVGEKEILLAKIMPLTDSNLIEVRMAHENRDFAMVVANALVEAGCVESRNLSSQEFTKARTYLENQLSYYSQRLALADQNIKAFNRQYGVLNFDQELLTRINRVSGYQSDLEQIDIRKRETTRAVSFLSKTLSAAPKPKKTDVSLSPTLNDYRSQLLPLEMELLTLQQTYTDSHPKVKTLKEKINLLKEKAKKEASHPAESDSFADTGLYSSIKGDLFEKRMTLDSLNIRTQALQRSMQKEQTVLDKLTGRELQYSNLLREKITAEKLTESLRDLLERMKVSEVMKTGNAQVLEEAVDTIVLRPADAGKVSLAFLISVMLGITFGVAAEFLDDTIRTSHHVKRFLNLETLGGIPHIDENNQRVILHVGLKSPLSENYHKLAFHVEQTCMDMNLRTLILTSALAGEGKTTVTLNLGISLARAGEKVIIVDGDLRRPEIHKHLGISNTLGLTSVLTGELQTEERSEGPISRAPFSLEQAVTEVLKPAGVEGLFIMPSGPSVANPVSLLRSETMKQVVEILKSKATFVIFDTPPVSAVVDSTILGSFADGVILLIDTGSTRRREVAQTKLILTNLKYKIIGVILNNISLQEPEYYYYHYYSYAYEGGRRKKLKRT